MLADERQFIGVLAFHGRLIQHGRAQFQVPSTTVGDDVDRIDVAVMAQGFRDLFNAVACGVE